MVRIQWIAYFIGLLGFACASFGQKADIPLIEIKNLWDSKGYVKLSEIADSIEYIRLEKTDACVLPADNNLGCKMVGDLIFVLPRKNPIIVFNRQGKYQFTLGRQGKGPGDYLNGKVQYDKTNSIIWVLDRGLKKILKYDKNGLLLNELTTVDGVNKFCLHNSILYLLKFDYQDGGIKSEVLVMNADGIINKRISLYGKRKPGVGAFDAIRSFFGFVNGKLHFIEAPFLHGYCLSENDKWNETWSLDQGKKAAKPEEYYPSSSSQNNWARTHVSSIYETSNLIFISGLHERYNRYFVFDKKSGITKANHILAETTNTMDMYGTFNDIDGGLPFRPRGAVGNNSYVQINDALRYIDLRQGLLKYYRVDEVAPISIKFMDFCNTLNEEDNPVIMIVHLK